MQVVKDQARQRMEDVRDPESTLVHWHKANQVCDEESRHWYFNHEERTDMELRPNESWPPALVHLRTRPTAPKAAMSDGWFRTSGP